MSTPTRDETMIGTAALRERCEYVRRYWGGSRCVLAKDTLAACNEIDRLRAEVQRLRGAR